MLNYNKIISYTKDLIKSPLSIYQALVRVYEEYVINKKEFDYNTLKHISGLNREQFRIFNRFLRENYILILHYPNEKFIKGGKIGPIKRSLNLYALERVMALYRLNNHDESFYMNKMIVQEIDPIVQGYNEEIYTQLQTAQKPPKKHESSLVSYPSFSTQAEKVRANSISSQNTLTVCENFKLTPKEIYLANQKETAIKKHNFLNKIESIHEIQEKVSNEIFFKPHHKGDKFSNQLDNHLDKHHESSENRCALVENKEVLETMPVSFWTGKDEKPIPPVREEKKPPESHIRKFFNICTKHIQVPRDKIIPPSNEIKIPVIPETPHKPQDKPKEHSIDNPRDVSAAQAAERKEEEVKEKFKALESFIRKNYPQPENPIREKQWAFDRLERFLSEGVSIEDLTKACQDVVLNYKEELNTKNKRGEKIHWTSPKKLWEIKMNFDNSKNKSALENLPIEKQSYYVRPNVDMGKNTRDIAIDYMFKKYQDMKFLLSKNKDRYSEEEYKQEYQRIKDLENADMAIAFAIPGIVGSRKFEKLKELVEEKKRRYSQEEYMKQYDLIYALEQYEKNG